MRLHHRVELLGQRAAGEQLMIGRVRADGDLRCPRQLEELLLGESMGVSWRTGVDAEQLAEVPKDAVDLGNRLAAQFPVETEERLAV